MKIYDRALFTFSLLLGFLGASGSFANDLVTNSNVANLTVGSEIEPQSEIVLKEGEQISVIDLESGTTTELRGPYSGPLSKYVDPCVGGSAASDVCGKEINADIGATRGDIGSDSVGD